MKCNNDKLNQYELNKFGGDFKVTNSLIFEKHLVYHLACCSNCPCPSILDNLPLNT